MEKRSPRGGLVSPVSVMNGLPAILRSGTQMYVGVGLGALSTKNPCSPKTVSLGGIHKETQTPGPGGGVCAHTCVCMCLCAHACVCVFMYVYVCVGGILGVKCFLGMVYIVSSRPTKASACETQNPVI